MIIVAGVILYLIDALIRPEKY
ncbi:MULTISPECIES: potassium-transporting ATPase subunit F [Brevibacillus]|uniref:Potassium-transporting ATPase subunit F n=1 Tax=Brevibacillus laterosporus TaxID=1465 RepID=A0AAP8Q9L0_BRELA|nr:potassium-transporting ATPase subunit F [Brevibacillus laterosporus]RFB31583.1 potassium-transporting ATPase subunit F [Brevibacillus sp. VP]NKQ21012.1 potassium-transporting ATPase subunit F [Brevibacillus laterosporus]PPA88464.1 potassium-transporting ATPase subunit F [Brevibacillus laterosporus]PPA92833.1 potassium-transporting ATPase subunit F [Brevibacillus laterosporus]